MADNSDLINTFYNTYGRPRGYLDPVIPVSKPNTDQSVGDSFKHFIGQALTQGLGGIGAGPKMFPYEGTSLDIPSKSLGQERGVVPAAQPLPVDPLDRIKTLHQPTGNLNKPEMAPDLHNIELMDPISVLEPTVQRQLFKQALSEREAAKNSMTERRLKTLDLLRQVTTEDRIGGPSGNLMSLMPGMRKAKEPLGDPIKASQTNSGILHALGLNTNRGKGNFGTKDFEVLPPEANLNPGPVHPNAGVTIKDPETGATYGPMRTEGPNRPNIMKFMDTAIDQKLKVYGYDPSQLTQLQKDIIIGQLENPNGPPKK